MLENWLESIKSMGIFLVCAQALIYFKPKGAYEKYLRLLVSVMLLVLLIEPLGSMLGFLQKGELQRRVGEMERKIEQIRQQSYSLEGEAENIWSLLLQDINWNDTTEEYEGEGNDKVESND